MQQQHVEIELDGNLTTKRCPVLKKNDGSPDYQAIRAYFSDLGYTVGTHVTIC